MIDEIIKYLTNVSVLELMQGYTYKKPEKGFKTYICLFCGKAFEEGFIYQWDNELLEAERAAYKHVSQDHNGSFEALLDLGKDVTGFSDMQNKILKLLYKGYSDANIARETGGKSVSTIRNHRFQLRKKKREAMIQLAVLSLIETQGGTEGKTKEAFYEFAGPLTVDDDRTMVTVEEAEHIRNKCIDVSSGSDKAELKHWPTKQKEKLVVLDYIARLFEPAREYIGLYCPII